ncbi:hypothetical protein TraAM80_07695 [Trypanosoma rangeli]|uniref:Uncharacterized protein n=1 Tax=Trypanosoma rangeli TaxID=5698 RepID=A0A3R7NBW7_TRYRA|nr:uncharacterized protein TraAM80_07695 [Trypanosoma rangeli]RNF00303.1 hypothetical protein TraAM80_07695 [Trypanosoma rangeli]|eukprot:RNF00303.1 hypothetical protein TraAM80_07695 [Trypanosoma rangeli]
MGAGSEQPMRKRDRSNSESPVFRGAPPVELPGQRMWLRQQVLFDVLRRTSLAEQKDREIVEWLTDAAEWLQGAECARLGAGSLTELRFLVLGVLHTMPWWRVVEAVDPKRVHVASRGAQSVTRAITRWHEKIQIAFERVCMLLIEQSPHAVRGVLEVAMKPFQMRPPVADGARRLIPADSIMRIMNTVATKYPSAVVLEVLEQSMRSLVPKRRWVEERHHKTCIALFLHLALEAHVPSFPTPDYGQSGLFVNCPATTLQSSASAVSVRASEDSGTDAAASSASNRCYQLRPLEMTAPVMSASEADFSDAAINMSSAADGRPFPTRFTEFTMQNNKMLAYRNELIRFVLQQLFDMELSLQNSDNEPLHEFSSSSLSLYSSGPANAVRILGSPLIGQVEERGVEKPFVEILRSCTSLVFYRLAGDLMRQQAAGVCGNAEWWRELLAFHLNFVMRMECPMCLLYLAPSLALLGNEEEAVDMMHKLVSLVTKGYMPVQQNTRRVAAAGPARVRMAPPSVGPLMIPMAHRVRAAVYLYPLFSFLRDRLGNGEGTRKRLQKWVTQELRVTAVPSISLIVQVLFAQCAAMSQLLEADFVEEMNSQLPGSAALRSLWERFLLPEDVKQRRQPGDSEEVPRTTTTTNPGANSAGSGAVDASVGKSRVNLAKMEAMGLLHPKLMNNCPWDWRRCQAEMALER